MNPTIKHEKDNRKRIEYDAVGYIVFNGIYTLRI